MLVGRGADGVDVGRHLSMRFHKDAGVGHHFGVAVHAVLERGDVGASEVFLALLVYELDADHQTVCE